MRGGMNRAWTGLCVKVREWLSTHRFPTAIDGVAAVEFALVLPVMITMLLGMSEVTLAVNVDRKLTLLSRSLADLSSRVATINADQLKDNFLAAAVIMQPFDASRLKMVVTSVKVRKNGNDYEGWVDWSCSRGPGSVKRTLGTKIPEGVPTGFQTATSSPVKDTYFMLIDVSLDYSPIFGRTITGTLRLGDSTPWPVRNSDKVTLENTNTCPPVTG